MTNSYPPPPAQPAPYTYGGNSAEKTNVLAIISLVASLVGIFFWYLGPLAGIICGHIALSQIKKSGEKGHGMALAGVIVGYILLALQVLGVIAYIVIFAAIIANSPDLQRSLSTSG